MTPSQVYLMGPCSHCGLALLIEELMPASVSKGQRTMRPSSSAGPSHGLA